MEKNNVTDTLPRDIDVIGILQKQREFFRTGNTLSISFRIEKLKKLKSLLIIHQAEIITALNKDLNRSEMESTLTEMWLVKNEIDYIIKNLPCWAKPKKTSSIFPLNLLGKSTILFEPYGSVLIISPWNYPLLLVISPLIGAICAGNCVVIKPSEIAEHTQNVLSDIINKHFAPEHIVAIKGGPVVVNQLLQQKFDYIFFTGSAQNGKQVMAAAAKFLTPLTLELGGKSPCIVDETANLDLAANRIIWAKTSNAGQVCIAPDYLYVHESCKDNLVKKLVATIKQFYGDNPEKSTSFCRIINKKHFDRIMQLTKKGNILLGGVSNADDLYIAPTLIENITWEDPIMLEEIFGPLLPILTYQHLHEVIDIIKTQPKSLALYFFTNNKQHEKLVLESLSFGNGCINDCMVQIANYYLPFGGVALSGMGQYRGQSSFNTFSHQKSVFKRFFPVEIGIDRPPYTERKLVWLKRLLRLE